MREIVLDTETTGLDVRNDRIIEIGCIELQNHIPTGETFHTYVNPKCQIAEAAIEVHGITEDFLTGKPEFSDIADDLNRFLASDPLIIHNAAFDLGFLNAEFDRIGYGKLPPGRSVDTLMIARRKFPGGQNSLDGLCRRFNIDNSSRTFHGALLDAELLADVYLELIGGRQRGFAWESGAQGAASGNADGKSGEVSGDRTVRGGKSQPQRPAPLASRLTESECRAHREFVAGFPTAAIWKKP